MRGSIRMLLGFITLAGVAGGIDTATDGELVSLMGVGVIAALVLYSGMRASKSI